MHWKLSGLMKKDRRDDVSTLGQSEVVQSFQSPRGLIMRNLESSSLIMRLPSEILYLIFGHLNDRKDFVALSHTCRIFRALAGKYLYSHVDMVYPLISIFSEEPNSSQSSRYIAHRLNIYQTLAGPSYSGLVTSFEFEFPECYCYSKRKFGSLRAKVIPKCDEVDFQLSNFLPTLPNLHTLKITCRACRTPGIGKRHKYISNLKTTSLKRLCFNCTCSSESIEWTCAVLSAPCLQSVEELDWDQPLEREDGEFQIGNMLPRLQRLDYTRNVILEELLACRPITHLACRVWDDKLQEALRMGSKRLTWLHIGNDAKDIYSWVSDRTEKMSQAGRSLVVGVQSNPKAFRSVSHLGGLCFFYSNVCLPTSIRSSR